MSLVNDLLNECSGKVVFNMSDGDSVNALETPLAYPNLVLQQLYQTSQRIVGHVLVPVTDESFGTDRKLSVSVGKAMLRGSSVSVQVSRGDSAGRNWSQGQSWQESTGSRIDLSANESDKSTIGGSKTTTAGQTVTDGHTQGSTQSAGEHCDPYSRIAGYNASSSWNDASQHSTGNSKSRALAESWTQGQDHGRGIAAGSSETSTVGGNSMLGGSSETSRTRGLTTGTTQSVTDSVTTGFSQGTSHTVHHKHTFLPIHEEIVEATGRTTVQVSDFLAFFRHVATRLPKQFCFVRCGAGRTHLMRVAYVHAAYEGRPLWKQARVTRLLAHIRTMHPFYFENDEPCKKLISSPDAIDRLRSELSNKEPKTR